MRTRYLWLAIALLALAGCASQTKSNVLQKTLSAYEGVIRWGDIASATRFIDPEALSENPPDELQLARYQHVRISNYQTNGPVPTNDTTVRQRVSLGVINIHTQRERTVVDEQVWRYDPEAEKWWLESGLPDITQ